MGSASNEGIDGLIRGAYRIYQNLTVIKDALPGRIFIPVYSPGSEKSIKMRQVKAKRAKDPNRRPDVEMVDLRSLAGLDAGIRQTFNKSREHKYDGIYEPRVQDVEFSLGEHLLYRQ